MARKRVAKRTRRMRGRGFFGSLWEGIKRAVTKPSTWLTAGGFIPSPLSLPLKVAGTVAGLAGHGRRRKARRRVGRGLPVLPPVPRRPIGAIWGLPPMRTMPYTGPQWMDGKGRRRKIGRGIPSTDPLA